MPIFNAINLVPRSINALQNRLETRISRRIVFYEETNTLAVEGMLTGKNEEFVWIKYRFETQVAKGRRTHHNVLITLQVPLLSQKSDIFRILSNLVFVDLRFLLVLLQTQRHMLL